MDALNIMTLNTKGLNISEKRRMLLHDMQRMKADITLLQETHFRGDTFPVLKNRYYPTVYHSTYSETKSRGVSILISARIPWTLIDMKTDPLGRFLFLKGWIGDVKVTVANLYMPNNNQDTSIKKHLEQLQKFTEGQHIVGGVLNIPLVPEEDTLTGKTSISRGQRKTIQTTLHNTQLIDVWRLFHPGERDYTFYSRPHHTYSRIDYFLIPHSQLQAIKESSIGSITWSDYAPVILKYALTDVQNRQRKPWRLNESLLQNPEVLADVTKEIGHFFQTNDTMDSDMGVIWETHKAVIRGILIKHGSRIKSQRTAQLTSLLSKLQQLETKHKQTQTGPLESELNITRKQITDLLQFKAKATLPICRKKVYESGNKCGRFLAQTLRTQRTASYIPRISASAGQTDTLPEQISQAFKTYYASLYNLPTPSYPLEQMTEYRTSSLIPTLPTEAHEQLEEPITLLELQTEIGNTKPGKAPGPDCLTTQDYKTLLPSLGTQMIKTFQ